MPTDLKKKPSKPRRQGKPGHAVGLEFDHLAVRAARLTFDGHGGFTVDRLADAAGDFSDDANLHQGLNLVKEKVGASAKDIVVSCLSGKQVSASQIPFRRLPDEEMEQALRLEMRKSVPFEVTGSTLDYQIVADADPRAENVQVLVAMAGAGLLGKQLKLLEKAGLEPTCIDVLPVAVANAMWTSVGAIRNDNPHVAIHLGPQVSTIVIDGARSPFFNRYVYFAAEDALAAGPVASDALRRLGGLADEVSRSLAFYEKSAHASNFQEIQLLGEFLESPVVADALKKQTGLPVRIMDLPGKLGYTQASPKGRFDLAVALAMCGGGLD